MFRSVTWHPRSLLEEAELAKKHVVDLKADEREMLNGLIASGPLHAKPQVSTSAE